MEKLIKKMSKIKGIIGDMKIKTPKLSTDTAKPPKLDMGTDLDMPNIPKVPETKPKGIDTASKKSAVKMAEQAKTSDPKMKEAQMKVAKDNQRIMVKSEGGLAYNDHGQWSLTKTEESKFHMHSYENHTTSEHPLTNEPTPKSELMRNKSFARKDGKPHKDWNSFIDHSRKNGITPVSKWS